MPSLSDLTKPKPNLSVDQPLPADTRKPWTDEDQAALDAAIEAARPPGRLESTGRGFVGQVVEMGDTIAQTAYDMSLAPGARRGEQTNIINEPGDIVTDDLMGMKPAQDKTGERFESFGRGAAQGAALAPVAAGGAAALGVNPAIAVLAEMGLSGVSNVAAEELEQDGHPGMAMAAGTLLGGPTAGTSRTVQKSINSLSSGYKAIAKTTAPVTRYINSENLQVSKRSLVASSEELKRRTPDVPAAIGAIKRAEGIDQDMPGLGLSTRQVMDNMPNARGGPHYAAMDERLSRDSIEYGTFSALRRANNLDHLAQNWELLGGDEAADYITFLAQYDEGADVLKQAERLAWSAVRAGDQPRFNMSDIQAGISAEIKGVKFTDDVESIPSVFRDALDAGIFNDGAGGLSQEMSLNDFQQMRSILLETVREGSMAPTKQNRRAAAFAIPILEKMQLKIDKWADLDETGKSVEYLAAKQATLENKQLYDPNSPVVRALDQGGVERNVFTAMRNARGKKGTRMTPASEADRLVRVASQVEGGVQTLRKLAVQDLFSGTQGLNPTQTRMPLKTLTTHKDAYHRLLGDQYEDAVELLELSQMATRGAAGTPNQAMRTGSGIAPAQFLFGLAKNAASPVPGQGLSRDVISAVQKIMQETKVSEIEQLRILVKAMEDKKFTRLLLEMPTEAALPAWVIGWKQLIKASAAGSGRQAARAGATRDE